MWNFTIKPEDDLPHKLKWLIFFRILFASLMLGSAVVVQVRESPFPLTKSLIVLYGVIVGIFLLSVYYALIFRYEKLNLLFPYIQLGIDTFIVTVIIFITGSFTSVFSFLYLVVIIYSSMIIYRRGSMVMAILCSVQYGILINLEYYGIINPFFIKGSSTIGNYASNTVLFKVVIAMLACFAVAFLSGLLSEQVRRTAKELSVMEDRVKRVEKMAYMGEMAAGITHEIKNPLASLAGSIQILRKEIPYDPEHDKLMQIVLRETDRLNMLVSNFLLFAKPPVGKIEKIELENALKETLISINIDLVPNIWVQMDPVHLRQVMWNLLLNAAEAIEGEGFINVKTYPLRPNYACVEVSDNGIGMTKKLIQSIFDPFFTTKPTGTGLGLSIVHSILESYNSWLDVVSKVGEGTKFTWKLNRIGTKT